MVPGDHHLRLLAQARAGTIDLNRIVVRSLINKDVVCQF